MPRKSKARTACEEYLASEWRGLIRLDKKRFPLFQQYLQEQGWLVQSPDVGECLRICRDGRTLTVRYNGKTTVCGSFMHTLWLAFESFVLENPYRD